MIKATDFIHPEDAAALRQLESIPGFPTLVKKLMSMGLEQLQYGVNMASAIRLSPNQLPKLYNRLPPICKKLGIEQPEFYLSMDPNPNAWTFGDTKIFITITSGLVDMMTEEELDAVIAHECGHILCHHVLYHSIAHYVMDGLDSLGVLGSLGVPIQYAILRSSDARQTTTATPPRAGSCNAKPAMAITSVGIHSQYCDYSSHSGKHDGSSIWRSVFYNKEYRSGGVG